MTRWAIFLASFAAIIGSQLLLYDKGKTAGRRIAAAYYVEQLREAEAETQRKSDAIEQMTAAQLVTDQQRDTTHREILRESTQIIDRPVYRDACVDADGLRILDRIAANANGEDPAAPANPSAATAARPAKR